MVFSGRFLTPIIHTQGAAPTRPATNQLPDALLRMCQKTKNPPIRRVCRRQDAKLVGPIVGKLGESAKREDAGLAVKADIAFIASIQAPLRIVHRNLLRIIRFNRFLIYHHFLIIPYFLCFVYPPYLFPFAKYLWHNI